MAGDALVLLVPAVEGVEVELRVAGQVAVREPETSGAPVNGVAGRRVSKLRRSGDQAGSPTRKRSPASGASGDGRDQEGG
jgi:hypothetical protein